MAQADHLPSPIRNPFPDGNETRLKDLGQPAAKESNKEGETSATRPPAPGAVPRLGHRKHFVGGSDARIIMGDDAAALLRLWREKRGEAEPEDLSGNLVVQLGRVTEELNRRWYEAQTGQEVVDVQKHVRHPGLHWMGATLDGRIRSSEAVFEGKFMLPWSFSEEAAVEKCAPQLQHNMWVVAARTAVLSIITGGGKWVEIKTYADPLYQHLIVTAERKFWRCVETGELPALFGVDPPKPRIEAVRIVDMTSSNAWAEFAAVLGGQDRIEGPCAGRRATGFRLRHPGQTFKIGRHQLRSPHCGGRACSEPVRPLAR
jgi:hypothetical protein